MKVCNRYFGEYFQNYISRYFRITESKIDEYSKNSFQIKEIEKIIDKYYREMGLPLPYIHYLDSLSSLYLMINEYNEDSNIFHFSRNDVEFESFGIQEKIEHLKNKHHQIQTEIDSQAIEQSPEINITELIKAIDTYKSAKDLSKDLKYFIYSDDTDKAFLKGKNISLYEHSFFNIANRNTIIVESEKVVLWI